MPRASGSCKVGGCGEPWGSRTSGDSPGVSPVIRTLASQSARARSTSYEASDDGASRQRVCDGKYCPELARERGIDHERGERAARLRRGIDAGDDRREHAREPGEHAVPDEAQRRRIVARETRARHEARVEAVHRERARRSPSPAASRRRASS